MWCRRLDKHVALWIESDGGYRRPVSGRATPASRVAFSRLLPRVQVEQRQLKQWYHTLDQLLGCKEAIEQGLYLRLRDLFSLRTDIVFYDLTSTYFEGKGPPQIGAYGHSRDGKPRNPQVLVGLVLVDGWPIAHHVARSHRRPPARQIR